MGFREGFVEADGFRIRYMEAGDGPPLIHLHGAGGPRLHGAHELLARTHRVVAFEMPGFGNSAENTRSASTAGLAATMAIATRALGLDTYDIWGTSFGARVALTMAADHPDRVRAVALEGPGAIRPVGHAPPRGAAEEMARLLFAHPDRVPPLPAQTPETIAKQRALVGRLRGPDRDAALEARLRGLTVPVLVLFGTLDHVMPSTMGRHYKEILPNCHLLFVYDAGHEIGTERPEAFADAVDDFLERHEAFVIARTPTLIHP